MKQLEAMRSDMQRRLVEHQKRARQSARKLRGGHRYWWWRGQLALYFVGPRMAIDRTNWAPGPWDTEPDWQRWQHRGLPCVIMRSQFGNWLGYVSVPKGHPWRGMPYGSIEGEVHGGITFADQLGADYWLGFDCSHYGDHAPGIAATLRSIGCGQGALTDGIYRDLYYVTRQTEGLAEQAASVWQAN